jgi:tRNA threonylcarbamoyladenosine biosynthesis protein TsaE
MKLRSTTDTKKLAEKISKIVTSGDVILLYGNIGVGKTTFVRFLIHHLEVENKIKKSDVLSPTFNIVYDYDIGKIKIFHYDLYRLKNNNDILELGMFDTEENSIKIIEWPELIISKPKHRIDILFKYLENTDNRKVEVKGFGKWKDYKFNEV